MWSKVIYSSLESLNLLIKATTRLNKVGNLCNKLSNNIYILWDEYPYRDIKRDFEYFVQLEWVEQTGNLSTDYLSYMKRLKQVDDDLENILNAVIDDNRELKRFLMLHSIFYIDDNQQDDRLIHYMLNKLNPDEEDIKWFNTIEYLSNELYELLKPLDPYKELITIMKDPVRIEFNMKNYRKNPICIRDQFDIISEYDYENIPNFLKSYNVIKL